MHETTRNHVENVVRKVKGHKLFSGRTFRGKFSTLNAALQTLGHSSLRAPPAPALRVLRAVAARLRARGAGQPPLDRPHASGGVTLSYNMRMGYNEESTAGL